MYKILLMISVFLLPVGTGVAHSAGKLSDKAAQSTQSKSDKLTQSSQSNKSTFTDVQCGDGASCPTGTECYYCPSTEQNECYVKNNVPSGCSPAEVTFKFLVKNQVIHLNAKKYNKYACKPPQVMKKLGNNLIECVDPADSAKSQTPAKPDSPQTGASR